MSNPTSYGGEYYQPGLMSEVGFLAAGILVVLGIFVAATVGARYLLLSSHKLTRGQRRILRILAGLARPSSPGNSLLRRQRRQGTRRKDEAHYRIKPSQQAETAPAAPMNAAAPERVERAMPKRHFPRNLATQPEEAWPFFAQDEIEAAMNVLGSGKVNQWTGTKVFEFEQAYTKELRNGRSIALANGSVALELALRALRIGPGDEVIVTPRSFVASAMCVRLVGATPVFADVDRDSGAMTAETVAAVVTSRTRAIIPVHLGGWPADVPAIASLARDRGIRVIEDCAQAHGAEIDGYPVGSFSDAAAFSFCQDKIITTAGEGGLLNLREDDAFERAWSFKDHGKNRTRALQQPSEPGFRWLHDSIGTNWRMTEIAAAIGLLQLDKLPKWRARRAANAGIWADALEGIDGIRVPRPPRNLTAAWYKFYAHVDVDPGENRQLRNRILKSASAAGLRAFSGSCSEIYREAAFADMKVQTLPIAAELADSSLMLEVHPTLDERRQRDRADAFAEIVRDILR